VTSTHSPAAQVQRAYVDQAAISYSFYVVGASTAFIAVALSLSETQAGLHSSAMAVGMIVAGLAGDRFDLVGGMRRVHLVAMGSLAVALVLLALAPSLVLTLAASLGIGLGAGAMFGHVNQALGAGGGPTARLQLTRAAFIAKASQLMAPVAIAVGAAVGLDWQFAVVPVLMLLGGLFIWSRADGSGATVHVELERLPRAYWLPWSLTVSVIGLEFFVVVWGGTLVAARTGASLADATLTISAFIAGMIAGRAVMSAEVRGWR
jgi:MFS family permease